jgi:hypothetical protein
MVNALAMYQRDVLGPYFEKASPEIVLWECSDALHHSDSWLPTGMSMGISSSIVLGPNALFIAASVWAWANHWLPELGFVRIVCLVASFFLLGVSSVLSCDMAVQRWRLRTQASKRGLATRR